MKTLTSDTLALSKSDETIKIEFKQQTPAQAKKKMAQTNLLA